MEKNLTDLKTILEQIIEEFSGVVSLDFRNAQGEKIVAVNENSVFPTASTIKVFILGTALEQVQQGKYSLEDEVVMKPEYQVGGSGVLKEFSAGSKYPIKDVATAMIILSDNTATNMMVDLVGGVDVVNAHIRKHGFIHTELRNKIDFEAIGNDVENLAVATTKEFTDYLLLFLNHKIVDAELVNVYLDILGRQQYLDQFPRYISYNPYAKELNMKQDVNVANKTGFFTGVRCDVGYLFLPEGKYAYSILTKDCADESFDIDNEASIFVGKVGKAIYDFLTQ